ncbi:ATP phosphoribosyltransferase [miscellaneous Crenarchaeota group-15 archaeon DG-45]|uniref:ATP phosphoribosyltransferase n=1 Tax=miscellaneous Crenarchaeota group-15 archaeon DG-45 TaxID=1685127 RepID=A0A0M0BRR6_9ARCH|nr:MAG: ATP phosphoribosyltransferase [miscellaneous Crenarchaeota group-15 archaeon DG-45]
MDRVKFAIPKGHLTKATFQALERAGYVISGGERSYRPTINDPRIELKIIRPQEIPIFVQDGIHDMGITGSDWLRETRVDVETLLDLEYSRVRIVACVPKPWADVDSLSDLLEKFSRERKVLRISTEYLNLTSEHLKRDPVYGRLYGDADPLLITPWWKRGENEGVAVYLSFGATEAKPPENADAIVDVIETGTTVEQNNLKVIETVMESGAVLIANKRALESGEKREKIYDVLTLLRGVVDGRKKLHIFVNVSKGKIQELLSSLPALKSPTIAQLSDKEWYSVNTVIEKDHFLEILPTLRRLAQGLVVYEPRQVLPLEEINSGGGEA